MLALARQRLLPVDRQSRAVRKSRDRTGLDEAAVMVGFSTEGVKGRDGDCGVLWCVETRVTRLVSFSIPTRKRTFFPDGSPSRALLGRREAVLVMPSEAVLVRNAG